MKTLIRFAIVLIVASFLALPAFAVEPYSNYTYDYHRNWQLEPQAYIPDKLITGEYMGTTPLNSPRDVFVLNNEEIYVVDTGNNRILVLDRNYKLKKSISEFDNNGSKDTFNMPQGIFVTPQKEIYVADTDNGRIVVLKEDGSLIRVIGRPQSALINKDYKYLPVKVAVDTAGRLYIVSANTTEGIIELNADGSFMSFMGAVPTKFEFEQLLRRIFNFRFLREVSKLSIPTTISSLAIDNEDFIYCTVAIPGDIVSDHIFIRRLNPSGVDVLKRKGVMSPMGDPTVIEDNKVYTSQLIDIAVRENGIYSVLGQAEGKVFTYSRDGELMYVFGSYGDRLGQFSQPVALDVLDNEIYLVVDSKDNHIITFKPTKYGKIITNAIEFYYNKQYAEAGNEWAKALQYTSKSELVYNGYAKAEFKKGNYSLAMKYFKLAQKRGDATTGYSAAFENYRNAFLAENFNYIVLLGLVVLILLIALRYYLVYRKRKRADDEQQKKWGLLSSILYAGYLIFHPFKAFWDLKREKKGNVYSASIIVAVLIIVFILRRQLTGFIINTNDVNNLNILLEISTILLPLIIWCIANWSITTLLDGEGKITDIYIATAYALTPLIIMNIPMIFISNIFTANEMSIYYLLQNIAIVWTVFLILVGIMTVHQFTMLKTVGTIMVAVLGMAVIIGVILLFVSLAQQLYNFASVLINEIELRY